MEKSEQAVFHLDTEMELLTDEHNEHMLSVNTTLVRGGVHRVQVWCATCRRHLTSQEAVASSIVE